MGILTEITMSFLLKNRETLTCLFKTFNLQEILQVNQNLKQTWHLLNIPPPALLIAMEKEQVSIDTFLGNKCLPLIRFYLADRERQKAVFLSTDLLSALFVSLPAVEATIFKQQIQRAQLTVQQANLAISLLLDNESLDTELEKIDAVIQLNHYQKDKNKLVNKQDDKLKNYLNCFYYLQAGELFVGESGKKIDNNLLLYSELSPLQQLQAQKLVTSNDENRESMDPQVVSA